MIKFNLIIFFILINQPIWAERYKSFESALLIKGQHIWMKNCEACHGWGVADAPIPMSKEDWIQRVEKPKSTLYEHAINGFFGPDDSMMPPKGGNPKLSDEEVKLAVDYMYQLATYHLNLK